MKWISIKNERRARDHLPKGTSFLAIWKDYICIAEFNEEDDHFYICFLPAQMSGIMKVTKDREMRFTHYCVIESPVGELIVR